MNYSLHIPVTFLREDKRYIAYTPVFDISTSGKTYAQAKKRFDELVEIFLEELEKMGTLNQTLKNLGWKKTRNEWKPPRVVRYVEEKIRMPV